MFTFSLANSRGFWRETSTWYRIEIFKDYLASLFSASNSNSGNIRCWVNCYRQPMVMRRLRFPLIQFGFVLTFLIVFSLQTVYSVAQAQKPVTAIGQIQVAAQNISCKGWQRTSCNKDLAFGFRQMLETAMAKSRKVALMERGQLDQLIHEQGLGQLGLTQAGGSIGGLTGVDYFVYGTITSFGENVEGTAISGNSGIGSLFGGAAGEILGDGIATTQTAVKMGVDLKVSEVATGRILIADSLTQTVKTGSNLNFGGVSQVDVSGDPFSDVQRVLAARIAEEIVTTLIPIKVIKVQSDGTLILNYGDIFLTSGEQLVAFEVGESFVDPDTGETLGSEEFEIGRVEVTRTEAKFSRGRIVGEPFDATGTHLKKTKSRLSQNSASQPQKQSNKSFLDTNR